MIQVYEKNGLFIIQNTITDIIYPNLTKQEAINLLIELGRTSDRVDNAIKDFNENNFQYENLEVDKTRLKYLQQQLADYEKKLEQSNNTIDHQSSLILEQNEFIKAYNQQLAEKDKEIKRLNNALVLDRSSGKWIKLCELQDKLAENAQYTEQLLKDNAQLKKSVEGKDKEISQLKKDLEAECNSGFVWEGEARTAWDELKKKDKEIEYLKRKWAITKDCLKRKEEELPHHDKMILHQICNNINDKLKEHCEWSNGDYTGWYITEEKINLILDQIEKGE